LTIKSDYWFTHQNLSPRLICFVPKKQMDLATKQDIENMKQEILQEIRRQNEHQINALPKYLKSKEVCKQFRISATKLAGLRGNGGIPCLQIGGQYLYDYHEIVNKFKIITQ
jgi:hypothetical protein